MIPPRTAIKGGEWKITIELEVDGEPVGDPLTLRFVDSAVVYSGKGKKLGMPEDFGYLLSLALHERATGYSKPTKKAPAKLREKPLSIEQLREAQA